MKTDLEVPSSAGRVVIRPRLICLGLALLTLLAYLPVYQHRFLFFDDPLYITENKAVQAGLTWKSIRWALTDLHASIWHPVTWMSHMLDCQLFGLDSGAHHLMNALWHAISAGLVLLVFYRLTRALWPSAFAAALFALHPLRVESVAWAAERKDVLSTFFFLLTLLAYLRYVRARSVDAEAGVAGSQRADPSRRAGRARQRGQGGGRVRAQDVTVAAKSVSACHPLSGQVARAGYVYYGLALFCFALGLMSKAMLVTVPFVLLLLDVWPLQRVQWVSWRQAPAGLGRAVFEKVPFFVLTVAVSLLTLLAQRSDMMVPLAAYPLWLRAAYSVLAYGDYLLKTVWPVDLAIVYPLPRELPVLRLVLSVLALIGVSWACWRARRTRPHLLLGWLWFVGTLVPVIGLVQVGCQSMADRYTYLPHIGLFLALAFEGRYWTARARWSQDEDEARRTQRLRRCVAVAGVVLVASLILTERQLSYWVDGRTLFAHVIAVTRDNAFAHFNLAVSLEHDGQRDPARREYEEALRLDPTLPEAHASLGDLLNEEGETEAALAQYRESLRLQALPEVHENLGALLAKLGQFDAAMAHYAAAAKLQPNDSRPYYLMGKALLRQGQSGQAVDQFRQALGRDDNDLQALVFLARTLAADPDPRVRNGAQAVSLAERANTLSGGTQSFVLDTLAMAYAESGRFTEALQTQQQAIDRANQAGEKDALGPLQERLRLYRNLQVYRENFAAGRR